MSINLRVLDLKEEWLSVPESGLGHSYFKEMGSFEEATMSVKRSREHYKVIHLQKCQSVTMCEKAMRDNNYLDVKLKGFKFSHTDPHDGSDIFRKDSHIAVSKELEKVSQMVMLEDIQKLKSEIVQKQIEVNNSRIDLANSQCETSSLDLKILNASFFARLKYLFTSKL